MNERLPGWYEDPEDSGRERYWDGLKWDPFPRTKPLPPPPSSFAAAVSEADERASSAARDQAAEQHRAQTGVVQFNSTTQEFLGEMRSLGNPGLTTREYTSGWKKTLVSRKNKAPRKHHARGWFVHQPEAGQAPYAPTPNTYALHSRPSPGWFLTVDGTWLRDAGGYESGNWYPHSLDPTDLSFGVCDKLVRGMAEIVAYYKRRA